MICSRSATIALSALALLTSFPGGAEPAPPDDGTAACSPVSINGQPPTVSGGCRFAAVPARTRFSVLTLGGPVRFEDCDVQFEIHLGADGSLGVAGIGASDVRPGGACGDIIACRWEGGDKDRLYDVREIVPWGGRVADARSDGYRLSIEVCFNTCMGRFEGPLDMRLERTARGWRATAPNAAVGTSGMQIDGTWNVELELDGRPLDSR